MPKNPLQRRALPSCQAVRIQKTGILSMTIGGVHQPLILAVQMKSHMPIRGK